MSETAANATMRIYIANEQRRKLKELAEADKLSVSWLIRRAIDEYLARRATQREESR